MTTQQAFVSYDGEDPTGVRAEVHVQKGVGTVSEIDKSDNGKSARIVVKNPGLKYPVGGNININDPLFPQIQEAFDSATEVNYRIESQRKKNVDRSKPIMPLRTTTELARENCISIFAGLNGELSTEAVTDPEEDPAPGGRLRAVDMKKPSQGASVTSQPTTAPSSASVSVVEEKPWVEYNSDGFPNLGSYSFGAALGIDSFVVRQLNEAGLDVTSSENDDVIFTLSKGILDIVDYVQVLSYKGHLRKADRAIGSHAKVRGVVFSTIEELFPLEQVASITGADDEGLSAWQRNVSAVSAARISRALRLGYPELFGPGSEIFTPGENVKDTELATKETIDDLRSLTKDSGITNLAHVSALLFKTFGTSKAVEVSDSALAEFIKFYGQHGVENFIAVANRAYDDVQSN